MRNESQRRPHGVINRVSGTVLLLVLFALSFAASQGRFLRFLEELTPYRWEQIECHIEESAVRHLVESEESLPHLFEARYRFRRGDLEGEGEQVRIGYRGSKDPRSAERLLSRFPAGATVPCYADPKTPGAVVLDREVPWWSLWLIIPAILVLLGLLGLRRLWFGPRRRPRDTEDWSADAPRSTSSRAELPWPEIGCGILVWSFVLFGGLTLVFGFLLPAYRTVQARSWDVVPCEVLSSHVQAHDGTDSRTFSVSIFYRYTVDGREYHSDRYDFLPGSSSGTSGKQRVVEQYPPGSEASCRVDPNDPTRAVFTVGFSREYWIGLVPLLFLLVGIVGVFFQISMMRGTSRNRSS